MIDDLRFALTVLAALGCGLMAGVFFAFSAFVMSALARLTPPQGIAAMQAINSVVVRSAFLVAFLATAAACALLTAHSLFAWPQAGGGHVVAGGALYLVGTVAVTIGANVPMNDALAAVDPRSADGAELWKRYLRRWSAWNHVRTACSLAAAAWLTLAACR